MPCLEWKPARETGQARIDEAHRFPGASAHFAAHADLVLRPSDLLAEHRAGRTAGSTGAMAGVLAFLEAWLGEHILRQDQDLGTFLRLRGAGG